MFIEASETKKLCIKEQSGKIQLKFFLCEFSVVFSLIGNATDET